MKKLRENWMAILFAAIIGFIAGRILGQQMLLNHMGWHLNSDWTDYIKDGQSFDEVYGLSLWSKPAKEEK